MLSVGIKVIVGGEMVSHAFTSILLFLTVPVGRVIPSIQKEGISVSAALLIQSGRKHEGKPS